VGAVAVLPPDRVVVGTHDGRVLTWDLAAPGVPAELGRHNGAVRAVAVLPGGQVVTGDDGGQVLMWDPAAPGVPAELGRHNGAVRAVAVLPGGQVVAGDDGGQVLMWASAAPKRPRRSWLRRSATRATSASDTRAVAGPITLGHHYGAVRAVAVLPGGQVVTGGWEDGLMIMWDPAVPDDPGWLGHYVGGVAVAVLPNGRVVSCSGVDGDVEVLDLTTGDRSIIGSHSWADAMEVLPGGQVVTGGDDSVEIWHPATPWTHVAQIGCPVTALAAAPLSAPGSCLVVVHGDAGFSTWSVRM